MAEESSASALKDQANAIFKSASAAEGSKRRQLLQDALKLYEQVSEITASSACH